MRDRLAEIFHQIEIEYLDYMINLTERAIEGDIEDKIQKRQQFYVNKLLENGVIVPKLDIGDKIKVWAKTIPTHEIDIEEEKIPEFLDGEVVSVRKTKKGWFFKFKVYARWTKDMFEWELGNYTESYMGVRYFSYPMSAIGKTVFLTKEEAEAKLKEGGKG